MKLLSPYTNHQFDNVNIDQYNYHHSTVLNNNETCTSLNKDHILYRRSHILNIICTFTYRAFKKHQKFNNELKAHRKRENTLVIYFDPNPTNTQT